MLPQSIAPTPPARPAISARDRRAFTLVELLVVIGIIVLLVGILLPALAAVSAQAKKTRTEATMNEFAKACDLFQQEHGFYPGVVTEDDLAANNEISGTENALLHLMGGYIDSTDPNYGSATGREFIFPSKSIKIAFDTGLNDRPNEMGNGPLINGKKYAPYYTPGNDELGIVVGQVGAPGNFSIPDLLDAWGQPIVYIRRRSPVGPIVNDIAPGPAPQFIRAGADPYLLSGGLGEMKNSQYDSGGGYEGWSTLNVTGPAQGNGVFSQADWNLMQLLAHQAFTQGTYGTDLTFSSAKGDYVIFSAGPDGVYFSRLDGAGSASDPIDEIKLPAVVDEFDDIVQVGGGS